MTYTNSSGTWNSVPVSLVELLKDDGVLTAQNAFTVVDFKIVGSSEWGSCYFIDKKGPQYLLMVYHPIGDRAYATKVQICGYWLDRLYIMPGLDVAFTSPFELHYFLPIHRIVDFPKDFKKHYDNNREEILDILSSYSSSDRRKIILGQK